jgi:hypothetical protein
MCTAGAWYCTCGCHLPPVAVALIRAYLTNRDAAVAFLNAAERVYVVDGYACWDPAVSCRLRLLLPLAKRDVRRTGNCSAAKLLLGSVVR